MAFATQPLCGPEESLHTDLAVKMMWKRVTSCPIATTALPGRGYVSAECLEFVATRAVRLMDEASGRTVFLVRSRRDAAGPLAGLALQIDPRSRRAEGTASAPS